MAPSIRGGCPPVVHVPRVRHVADPVSGVRHAVHLDDEGMAGLRGDR